MWELVNIYVGYVWESFVLNYLIKGFILFGFYLEGMGLFEVSDFVFE